MSQRFSFCLLIELPPSLINQISRLLDGLDIGTLTLHVGNKSLKHKLCSLSGVQEFHWERLPQKWEPSYNRSTDGLVLNWPLKFFQSLANLRVLNVAPKFGNGELVPLTFNNVSLDGISSSIQQLHLKFLNASFVFLNSKSFSSSSTDYLFPYLKSLDLESPSYQKISVNLNKIPLLSPCIQHLSIKTRNVPSVISLNQLNEHLQSLIFGAGLGTLIPWTSVELKQLPRNLKNLDTGSLRVNLLDIADLPPELTSLSINAYLDSTNISWSDVYKHLPSKLVHLNLRDPFFEDKHIQHLPKGLLSLVLPLTERISSEYLKQLPIGLTKLDIPQVSTIGDQDVALLPKGLVWLNIRSSGSITEVGLGHLPDTLLHLFLSCTTLDDNGVKYLPPNLQTLDFIRRAHLTAASLSSLPKSLTSLHFELGLNLHDEAVKDFPRSITVLNVGYGNNVSHHCFKYLPQNLIEFECGMIDSIPAESVINLPRSLTKLVLKGPNLTPNELSLLPPYLEELAIPFNAEVNALTPQLPKSISNFRNILS